MNIRSRLSIKRLILVSVSLAVLFLGWALPFQAGMYWWHVNAYSKYVSRSNQVAAEHELATLQKLYETSQKYHLDGLANRYVFDDFTRFDAAYNYMTGDFDKVHAKLLNGQDFQSCYMRGNAKWRMAQDQFRQGLNLQDKEQRMKLMKRGDELAQSTKDDYLCALKEDRDHTLPPSWNYDITTDDGARMRALMPKPGKIIILLGDEKDDGDGTEGLKGPRIHPNGSDSKDVDKKGGGDSKGRGLPGIRRKS